MATATLSVPQGYSDASVAGAPVPAVPTDCPHSTLKGILGSVA